MSFYNDGERIDLATIRPYHPKTGERVTYTGNDPIKQMLHVAWDDVHTRFFKKGRPVVFLSPSVRSGMQHGGSGYNCPRNVIVQTDYGTKSVVWADTAVEKDGNMTYLPTRYDMEERKLTKTETDIEEILFMICFNPHFAKDGKMNDMKKTYMKDDVSDAEKQLGSMAESAGVVYLLTSPNSPISSEEEIIDILCLAWGVSKPETKEMGIKKLELLNAVQDFSKKGEKAYSYDAFEKAVKDVDTPRISNLALIQACLDRNGVKLNKEQFRWELIGEAGQTQKILVKVPPQDMGRAKDILLAHLMSNPSDVEILESLVSGIKLQKSKPKELGFEVPKEVTEVWLNELGWPELKRLYRLVTQDINWKDKKKEQMVDPLKEFFITNKKTLADLE